MCQEKLSPCPKSPRVYPAPPNQTANCTPPRVSGNRLAQEPPPGSAVEFSHYFFLPQNWVFRGSGGCRTAIQVCRTIFYVYCMVCSIWKVIFAFVPPLPFLVIVVLPVCFPPKFDRGTRGCLLHTTVSSPVPWKKNFPACCARVCDGRCSVLCRTTTCGERSIGPKKVGDLRFLLVRPRRKEIGNLRLSGQVAHWGVQNAVRAVQQIAPRAVSLGVRMGTDLLHYPSPQNRVSWEWDVRGWQLKQLGASPDAHCVCTQYPLSQTGHQDPKKWLEQESHQIADRRQTHWQCTWERLW